MKRQLFVASAILALAASGCSGSGSGAVPINTTGSQSVGTGGTAAVTLKISPQGWGCSTNTRNAQYISTNTGSIAVTAPGIARQVIPLSGSSGGCGTYSATFNAPIGNPSLSISTYQSADGSGAALSQATQAITVTAAGPNSLSVTLDGVVAALSLAVTPTALTNGTSGSLTATWTALDASGATIIGPGALVNPDGSAVATPTLTNDATAGITIGAYTASSYGGSWTVSYSGASTSTPITFSAKSGSATPGTAQVTVGGGTALPTDACQQAYTPQSVDDLSNEGAAFFSSVLPNAHMICVSAWDFSGDLDNALIAAAHNGAKVVAIAPWSQNGSNSSDITALTAAGVEVRNEYVSTVPPAAPNQSNIKAPFDIHAKFALVDGVAYLDGHNWFTTDVVMKDTIQGDFNAMQSVLTTFGTPSPSNGNFTTDKQVSLQAEAAYINGQSWGPSTEYDFITESFNPVTSNPAEYNGAVYDAMCSIAKTGATMHLMFESYTGYSATAKAAIQDLLAVDANATAHYNSSGHEKISMKRGASVVWFGSSNSTTTDLFDWGYTLSDTDVITALQTYFDGQFNGSTNVAPTGGSGTYCHA